MKYDVNEGIATVKACCVDTGAYVDVELTHDILNDAYRIIQKEFLQQDAINHIADNGLDIECFTQADLDEIVQKFQKWSDCNTPENATWDHVLSGYSDYRFDDEEDE